MLGFFVVFENFEVSSCSDFMYAGASLFTVNVSGTGKFSLTAADCPALIGDFGVLNGLMCLCLCGETDGGGAICG